MEGRSLWVLVATDMATGWSECLPMLNRGGASVMATLRKLEELLSLNLRGIDVGNDGAVPQGTAGTVVQEAPTPHRADPLPCQSEQ